MAEFDPGSHHGIEQARNRGFLYNQVYRRYGEQITQRLVAYTGSPDVYLEYDRTQELAEDVHQVTPIRPGEFLALDMCTIAGRQLTERQEGLKLARSAIHELVECNLRFAKLRADASVGLYPHDRLFNTSFTDVRKLRSLNESYENRLQAANLGLVMAANKYKPGMKQKETDDPLLFLTVARMRVDAALYNCVLTEETRFFQPSVPMKEQITKDAKNPPVDAEARAQYVLFQAVQNSESFEEIDPETVTDHTIELDPTADAAIIAVEAAQCMQRIKRRSRRNAGIIGSYAFEGRRVASALYSLSPHRVGEIVQRSTEIVQEEDGSRYLGNHDERMMAFTMDELLRNKDLFAKIADPILPPVSERAAAFVEKAYEAGLRAKHIETMWNDHWDGMVAELRNNMNGFDVKRFSQIMALLLGNVIRKDETVTLHVPKSQQGKLQYVGAWAKRGEIVIVGDVGDFTGAFKEDRASVTVIGSVGAYAGFPEDPSSIVVHPKV